MADSRKEHPDSGTHSFNSPLFDEKGRRIVLRECWRRPSMPFKAPVCHGRPARRVGGQSYRCVEAGCRIEPERLYHRLMLRRNPFLLERKSPWRRLVRVTRWAVSRG